MGSATRRAPAAKSGRTTLIAAWIDPSGYVAQFNASREP
jgi:hypothetical protein